MINPHKEHQARLEQQRREDDRVFDIQNRRMKVWLACPIKPTPHYEDCHVCGNLDCIDAHNELRKIWPKLAPWPPKA